MTKVFTEPGAWIGGSVDLLLLFGPTPGFRVEDALRNAWAWPRLAGPFPNNIVEPASQALATIESLDPEQPRSFYGVGTLPNGSSVAFKSYFVCSDDGTWIYLGSPLGSLAKCYATGTYPMSPPTDPWVKEVYGWFAELAFWVFERCRFSAGMIGWMTEFNLDDLLSASIPERRYQGYLVVTDDGLQYLPPNVNEPLAG